MWISSSSVSSSIFFFSEFWSFFANRLDKIIIYKVSLKLKLLYRIYRISNRETDYMKPDQNGELPIICTKQRVNSIPVTNLLSHLFKKKNVLSQQAPEALFIFPKLRADWCLQQRRCIGISFVRAILYCYVRGVGNVLYLKRMEKELEKIINSLCYVLKLYWRIYISLNWREKSFIGICVMFKWQNTNMKLVLIFKLRILHQI